MPPFVLIREKRRTVALKIHPDGRLLVKAPHRISLENLHLLISKRVNWIQHRQAFLKECVWLTAPYTYCSGESLLYLGDRVELVTMEGPKKIELSNGKLIVTVPSKDDPTVIKKFLNSWYKQQAQEILSARLDHFLRQFKEFQGEVTLKVRAMTSLWGSCSPKGQITLNIHLIKTPLDCIDCIVMHEICHLAVRGHGKQFYNLLGNYIPDWREREEKLKYFLCR